MSYDGEPDPFRPLTPDLNEGAAQRAAHIRGLGLTLGPNQDLDEFARQLVADAGERFGPGTMPVAFVNLITATQFAAGLSLGGTAADSPKLRQAPPSMGFCPSVVVRRKALVLDDVCESPRFAGNPFIDALGVRTYVGAPLVDPTGVVVGTVCIVDRDPRPWGRDGLHFIKGKAFDLGQQLQVRPAALLR